MIEQNGYPLNENEVGIPFNKLLPNGRTTLIESSSGRLLECRASAIDIRAVDVQDNTELYAAISGTEMKATLRTKIKNQSNIRHPDMYASKFLEFAVHYFEGLGQTISSFQGKWSPGSDNYLQFWEHFQTSNNKTQAAISTWTGRAVGKLGFTEITDDNVWILDERVIALFKRP